MADVFTHIPSLSSSVDNEPRVNSVKFGNGYEQVTGDGLNSNLETWNLIFNVEGADKDSIIGLFEANFRTYMLWTPPEEGAIQKKYSCRKWRRNFLGNNNYEITAVFNEWAGLA